VVQIQIRNEELLKQVGANQLLVINFSRYLAGLALPRKTLTVIMIYPSVSHAGFRITSGFHGTSLGVPREIVE
jgi:hypothetical protein